MHGPPLHDTQLDYAGSLELILLYCGPVFIAAFVTVSVDAVILACNPHLCAAETLSALGLN